MLATSWTANSAGDVWTFKIRQGVKFHNGAALTADDVVYTYQLHANPKNGSNALSVFGGVLTPSGVVKVDDSTVAFHLEAPNGNFPYLTSSDNYNMIILPNGYNPANWQSTFIGTGPFVSSSYTPKVGRHVHPQRVVLGHQGAAIGHPVHLLRHRRPRRSSRSTGGSDRRRRAVLGDRRRRRCSTGSYNIIKLKSSAHRELSMRCDQAPVHRPAGPPGDRAHPRPAGDRHGAVQGLRRPRQRQPVRARLPLDEHQRGSARAEHQPGQVAAGGGAGTRSGFTTQLITEDLLEIPDYAQIVVQSAAQIGVKINLKVESSSAYYGKATFGNSDWLDATMSLVDYGHRSVPNVFLTAPLETTNAKTGTGPWNAAHFNNSQYDSLVAQYVAAVDLSTQRSLAGQIETLLLDQTPIIFGYFYNYLTATAQGVTGVYPTAIGHLFLYNAAKS